MLYGLLRTLWDSAIIQVEHLIIKVLDLHLLSTCQAQCLLFLQSTVFREGLSPLPPFFGIYSQSFPTWCLAVYTQPYAPTEYLFIVMKSSHHGHPGFTPSPLRVATGPCLPITQPLEILLGGKRYGSESELRPRGWLQGPWFHGGLNGS